MINVSLEFAPNGQLYKNYYNYLNKSLVWVMILPQTHVKPLPEPIMTQVVDAYMNHQALMYFG